MPVKDFLHPGALPGALLIHPAEDVSYYPVIFQVRVLLNIVG